MSKTKRLQTPSNCLLTDQEFNELIWSDDPKDWDRIHASLDADYDAMSPNERAELDASAERLGRKIRILLVIYRIIHDV